MAEINNKNIMQHLAFVMNSRKLRRALDQPEPKKLIGEGLTKSEKAAIDAAFAYTLYYAPNSGANKYYEAIKDKLCL